MFCGNCGAEMNPGDAFCPMCGKKNDSANNNQPVQQATNQFYKQPASKPVIGKKNTKTLPIIIAAVAVVIVGLVLVKGVFGGSNSVYKVFEAAKKTVFESESATIIVDSYGDKFTANVKFGKNIDDSEAYMELDEDGDIEGLFGLLDSMVYVYDEGEEHVDDIIETIEEAIEEEYGILVGSLDIDGIVDKLLDGKISEAALEDLYNTVVRDAIANYFKLIYLNTQDYDFKKQYYNDTTGQYDISTIKLPFEIPDYDKLMDLIKDFLTKGLSDEAVSIDKDGKIYKYEIRTGEFLKCLLDFVKKNKTTSSFINDLYEFFEDDPDELYEDLEEELEYFLEDDETIRGEYEIKGGRLVYVKCRFDGASYSITVDDIGKTKVDKDKIEDIDTEGYNYNYYY